MSDTERGRERQRKKVRVREIEKERERQKKQARARDSENERERERERERLADTSRRYRSDLISCLIRTDSWTGSRHTESDRYDVCPGF